MVILKIGDLTMKHEIDLAKYKIRTDLMSEVLDQENPLEGCTREKTEENGITIETISLSFEAASKIGKKPGFYQTLYFSDITDEKKYQTLLETFQKYFQKFLDQEEIGEKASCLVVGLGNRKATPDALGPLTVDHVIVTRHLFTIGLDVDPKYRSVSSFAPGVFGTTGIETKEVLEGIIEKVKPDFMIVIDALAASSIERVNHTIQLTNTGIHPGSGIGNSRAELSFETLQVPVYAIGVPTVVDAVTIVSNTFQYMVKHFSYEKENHKKPSFKLQTFGPRDYQKQTDQLSQEEKEKMMGLLGTLTEEETKKFISEVLTPIGYNLMVTPKEIDFVIEKLSCLLSTVLNKVLHHL